jgi:hypothetical protein
LEKSIINFKSVKIITTSGKTQMNQGFSKTKKSSIFNPTKRAMAMEAKNWDAKPI